AGPEKGMGWSFGSLTMHGGRGPATFTARDQREPLVRLTVIREDSCRDFLECGLALADIARTRQQPDRLNGAKYGNRSEMTDDASIEHGRQRSEPAASDSLYCQQGVYQSFDSLHKAREGTSEALLDSTR